MCKQIFLRPSICHWGKARPQPVRPSAAAVTPAASSRRRVFRNRRGDLARRKKRRVSDQRKLPIMLLDQGGAAFPPIAAVIINDAAELPDGSAVNVAAKHSVDLFALGVMRDCSFEFSDKTDRVLYPLFGISTQRPIAEAEAAPKKIDERIKGKQKLVADVAGKGQP